MPPAPRLLQVIDNAFPPCPRAAALYTQEVAHACGGAVFSLAPAAAPAPDPPLFSPRPDESLRAAWHRALDQAQPHAVFVQHLGAANPALLLDLRERGIPYAVFLHDFTPLCPVQRLWHRRQERCSGPGRTGWKCAWCVSGRWQRWPELPLRTLRYRHRPRDWRTALVRADALVAASRYLREFWMDQGAPPERIAVIPPLLSAPPPPAPHPLGAPPRLLYAGGTGQDAGIEVLAGALELLHQPVQVEAIGCLDLVRRDALRAAIAPRHAVVFHGVVAPADLPALLAACDAVAVPARWEAAFVCLAAQAQAAGTPVVATAVGGLTERIIHGVNGYLAAPDDPHAFAAGLREAFRREPPAWADAPMRQQAAAEADAARAQLRRLLQRLASGATEPDPALMLEHGGWLEAAARTHAIALPEAAQRLVTALRQVEPPDPSAPASPLQSDCRARAHAASRQRQVDLNHAIAFFRACGCRRIAHWPAATPPAADAVACFQAWGLQTVPSGELPDGIFAPTPPWEPPAELDSAWLRHRFPQARALVTVSAAGVETTAWTVEGED
ncbi:MAG TPA: glycosyltransferase [Terriglobales bacterium]|nr:glycosyltransferase [Terriglobales bacterium]